MSMIQFAAIQTVSWAFLDSLKEGLNMTNEKVILGEGCIYSTDCDETGVNNNIIVCGGSGCGKTMSVSEPRLLETVDSSLITTVTKKRLVHKYKPLFESRGYEVWDLDFVNPHLGNAGYDPLKYVRNTKDIVFLARSLVMADQRKAASSADPFWEDSAVSLLSAEIAYTLYKNKNATFTDVIKMHDSLDLKPSPGGSITTAYDREFRSLAGEDEPVYQWTDPDDALFPELENINYAPGKELHVQRSRYAQKKTRRIRNMKQDDLAAFAVSCWNTFNDAAEKTARSIYVSLNSVIDSLFTSDLRAMIANKKSVDFKKIANKKVVLFVTTSPVNPSLNFFINMFYGTAIKQLFEYAEGRPDGTLPVPVHILCDDFATGGRIPDFPEYISIFREKKISVTLLIQSESQLAGMYGQTNATTIINNCDTYVYMGGMDYATAGSISRKLDVPVSDVLYMPVGDEIIFRRGQKPVRTKRYNIRADNRYHEVTEQYKSNVTRQR